MGEGKAEVLEIKQDLAKARDYFMSAADKGHIEAAFHAAQLLVPRNASPKPEVYMLETCQVGARCGLVGLRAGNGATAFHPIDRAIRDVGALLSGRGLRGSSCTFRRGDRVMPASILCGAPV